MISSKKEEQSLSEGSAQSPKQDTNTRQQILDAASRLIMKQGVIGTSLADIARETGISKGTLFYHFSAKNDLVYEVTDQHFSRITHNLLETVSQVRSELPAVEIFARANSTIITDANRGRLNLYLLADAVTDNEELRLRFRETYEEYLELMQQFITMVIGSREGESGRALASLLVAVLDGLIIQWLIEPEDVPLQAIAQILADIL